MRNKHQERCQLRMFARQLQYAVSMQCSQCGVLRLADTVLECGFKSMAACTVVKQADC